MENTHPDPGTTSLHQLKCFDNSAWTEVVDQYFSRIYGWCLEAGLEPHTASDITQNIFVSMLGSIHRFSKKDSGEFGGWVRRISQRRIADYFRSRQEGIAGSDLVRQIPSRAEIRDILENESQRISLEAISDDRMLRTFLQAQQEFKEHVWDAFWMVAVEGKSVAETALELGTTKNIVYLSKSRVKKRLKQIFDALDHSDDS